MVLEDRPAQFDAFSGAARRSACAVRDPRLCRGDAGHVVAVGPDHPCSRSRIPDECGADFGRRARRDPPAAGRRGCGTRSERAFAMPSAPRKLRPNPRRCRKLLPIRLLRPALSCIPKAEIHILQLLDPELSLPRCNRPRSISPSTEFHLHRHRI
jgi:hypothetical protein